MLTPARAIRRVVLVIVGLFLTGAVLVPLLSRDARVTADVAVARGQRVEIHADRGAITVRRGDGGVVAHQTYILSRPRLEVSSTDDGAKVDASCPGWAFASCSTDLVVSVPPGVSVNVVAGRGPVTVADVTTEVSARSDRGAVTVTGDPESVVARSVENTVTVKVGPRTDAVSATSETGDVVIDTARSRVGSLTVEAVTGKATVQGLRAVVGAQGRFTAHSGAGNVRVTGGK